MEKPGCVILAAGFANRFGANKLFESVEGISLIRRCFQSVPTESFSSVAVVSPYKEVLRLAGAFHFSAIHNEQPNLGQSHSLQMGLTTFRDRPGVCFLAADQPLLRRETVAELVEFWSHEPDQIAALGHDGVRGNPCIFPARLYPNLMKLTGDVGGREVIRHEASLPRILEAAAAELMDVDTPETLEQVCQLEKKLKS
jgi:molybdenum cofactor cytidylyltransferase